MNLAIDIGIEAEAWRAVDDLAELVQKAVEAALNECAGVLPEDAGLETEVSLVLCDDPFIRDLNAKWRGQDKPTNVLSFPAGYDDFAPALGDIVIAYETVAREAGDDGKTFRDHLAHMVVHGFLHLLGFDHDDDEEAEEMEALEVKALAALGIASPYEDSHVSLTAEDRRFLQ